MCTPYLQPSDKESSQRSYPNDQNGQKTNCGFRYPAMARGRLGTTLVSLRNFEVGTISRSSQLHVEVVPQPLKSCRINKNYQIFAENCETL